MPTPHINVGELISNDSFRAWTEGRADVSEKKRWDHWVQQSAKNRRLARQAQAEIIGFSFTSSLTSHTLSAWNRLQGAIADYRRPQRYPRSKGRREAWSYYGVAASILAIIVAVLSGLLMHPSPGKAPALSIQRTIQTAYGERKKITLASGASIVLNAHSALTYISNHPKSGGVHVSLRGEAYFTTDDHAQLGHTAFTVQTPDGNISDTGTQFMVSTREEHTRVILKRGQVSIDQSAGNPSKKPVVLHPGQMATFSKTSRHIYLKTVNPDVYTSWTTNTLVFDHTRLSIVKDRLEQTFGSRVVICNARLARRALSGSIKNGGLRAVVSAVAKTLHTSYTIKDNSVYFGRNCP